MREREKIYSTPSSLAQTLLVGLSRVRPFKCHSPNLHAPPLSTNKTKKKNEVVPFGFSIKCGSDRSLQLWFLPLSLYESGSQTLYQTVTRAAASSIVVPLCLQSGDHLVCKVRLCSRSESHGAQLFHCH